MPVSDDIRKEKEKTKDMSFKGKLSYFWYYYKIHTIVVIAIVAFLCTLIHDITSTKDYAFYAAYFNAGQTFSSEEQMAAFAEYADLDTEKYNVYLDNDMYYSLSDMSETSMAASQKFAALLYAGDVDVAVADEEVFTSYALGETFYDLRTILPDDLMEKYKDQLFYIDYAAIEAYNNEEALVSSGDDTSYYDGLMQSLENPDDPSIMENPIPVGIYVADTPVLSAAGCYQEDSAPVFGIMQNTKRVETAIQYLRFLGEEEAVTN